MQRQIQLAGQSSLSLSLVLLESSQLTALSFFLKKEEKKGQLKQDGLIDPIKPVGVGAPCSRGRKKYIACHYERMLFICSTIN